MAITHVRTGTGTGFSTTPSALMGDFPAQNNLLVSFFSGGTAAQTAINSYNQRTVVNDNTTRKAAFYDKIAGASESTTQAPATITAAATWTCTVIEYAGNATSNYFDVENGVQDNDATKTSPTVDPTDGIDVVIVGACVWNLGTGTVSGQTVNTSTTGVVERSDPNAGRAYATWDWIGTTGSGGYTTEGTASGVATGSCHIAIYKAAGGPTTHTASTTLSLTLGLLPEALEVGVASTTLALTLGLSVTALATVAASTTLNLNFILLPTAVQVTTASTTLILSCTLTPSASVAQSATTTLALTFTLAPVALRVVPASTTLALSLGLLPTALAVRMASTTLGLTFTLLPVSTSNATTTTLSLALNLSATAVTVRPASTTLSLVLTLAPVAQAIRPASTTLGLTLGLLPSGVRVTATSATLSLAFALLPTAVRIPIATTQLALTFVLSPTALSFVASTVTLQLAFILLPVAGGVITVIVATSSGRFGGGQGFTRQNPRPEPISIPGFGGSGVHLG